MKTFYLALFAFFAFGHLNAPSQDLSEVKATVNEAQALIDQELLSDVYDYDPDVATKAFNKLGADASTVELSSFRNAAAYSIRHGDNAFLNSDLNQSKLGLLAIEFLQDQTMQQYHLKIVESIIKRVDFNDPKNEPALYARIFLLKKASEITDSVIVTPENQAFASALCSSLHEENKLYVTMFCKHVSVKFIRSDYGILRQAFSNPDKIRMFKKIRSEIKLDRGMSVELFEMLLKEATLN